MNRYSQTRVSQLPLPDNLTIFFNSRLNPKLMVMKLARSVAINSNERVFPIFAKKLASRNASKFRNAASFLAAWLGSERAYYLGAHHRIRNHLTAKYTILSSCLIC